MKVFLSYRREDSAPWAGRLNDSLTLRFGRGSIFQDVVAIHPGERFVDVMDTAVSVADAVVVVIGPRWLVPRLGDPEDYVRRELVAALQHDKLVIPVLVGGAALPAADGLPSALRALLVRQAVTLQDDDWPTGVDRLCAVLGGRAAPPRPRRPLIAAGVVAAVVVAVVLGSLAFRGTDAPRAGVPTPPVAPAELLPCPLPAAAAVRTGTSGATGGDWTFTVTGGGYQPVGGVVVLTVRATVSGPSSENLDPDTVDLVTGDRRYAATCFDLVGAERVDPGGSTEAHVGFAVDGEPAGPLTVLVLLGGVRYRIDAT